MYSHVSYTWFFANVLHPFVVLLFFGISDYASVADLFGALFSVFIYSLIFSLPSLFISFLVVYLFSLSPASAITKYFCWMVVAPVVVVINYIFMFLLFGGEIFFSELEIALPAVIAVVITIIIRHKQFLILFNQIKKTKNENNLV
jgi:hypothetical protein